MLQKSILPLVVICAMSSLGHQARPEPEGPLMPLFPISENGRWGFIDKNGEVIVAPRFSGYYAYRSCTGEVTAQGPDGWLAIGLRDGNVYERLLPKTGDAVGAISIGDGLYRIVYYDDSVQFHRYEVMDLTGRLRITGDADWSWGFLQEERLPIKRDGKWGVIDRDGHVIVEPTYDMVFNYFEGRALVIADDKFGAIDRDGEIRVAPTYWVLSDFTNGLALTRDRDRSTGYYIRRDGTEAFEGRRFLEPGVFSEGLAAVKDPGTGLFGFIDESGDFVIPPAYERARDFSGGMAAARLPTGNSSAGDNGYQGYIDRKGQWQITVRNAQDLYSFRDGLALVRTTDWMGYINREGEWVWKTSSPWDLPFSEQQ